MEQQDISNLSGRFSDMEDKLEHLAGKVENMLQAITGNPFKKDGGMVQDMKETKEQVLSIEKRLEVLEDFRSQIRWTAAVIVSVSGFLGACVGLLLAYLATKK